MAMMESPEVPTPAAPAPPPPTGPQDPVAAAASQLVADVFVQLGMQELQHATAAAAAEAAADRVEHPVGCGSAGEAEMVEAAVAQAHLAPTKAAMHATAQSLPEDALLYMLEGGASPQEPETVPAVAEMGAELALEQEAEPAPGTEHACPVERPVTAGPDGMGREPASGEIALAACEGATVLLLEPSTAALAAVEGQQGGEAEPALAVDAMKSPAASATGMSVEQEVLHAVDAEHAQHGQLASCTAAEEPRAELVEAAPAGGAGSLLTSRPSDGPVDDEHEPVGGLVATAVLPASPPPLAVAGLEAADLSSAAVELPLIEPSAELATELGAAAELAAAAAGHGQEASSDAAALEEEAAQLKAELDDAPDEAQPDGAAVLEAASKPNADGWQEGQEQEQEQEQLGGSTSAALLSAADMSAGGEDVAPADAYSLALNHEVSAKLLAVLSEQQAQREQEGGQAERASPAASSDASPGDDGPLAPEGEEPGRLMAERQAEIWLPPIQALPPVLPVEQSRDSMGGRSPGALAPLLSWVPAGSKQGSPHLRRAPGTLLRTPAPAAGALAPAASAGGLSPTHRQRMAPLPAHSPTVTARATAASPQPGKAPAASASSGSRATFASAASRQRRLSKPSVHEILRTAGQAGPRPACHLSAGRHPAGYSLPAVPPLAGSVPMQLARGDIAGGPFPTKADAPSGALLHWGAHPPALAAPAMPLASPAGWYMPVPVPVGAGSQGGYLLHPGMMMAPAGTYVPGEAADVAGPSAKAAPTDGSGKVAANGPDGPAVEAADALPDGDLAQLQTEGEPAEHRRCPGPPAKAVAVEEQYDVAASWPPYEGAKLPPLHQDLMGSAGLIPAVHAASSFSVAPAQRGHSWAAQGGPAAPVWHASPAGHSSPFWAGQPGMPAPPMQWGPGGTAGYGPGAFEAQHQAAAMHLFVQQQQAAAAVQVQYAQQAAAYGHSPQYGAQQGYAGAGMHEDGPLFFRDPPPPVPVAIDARGRPFKVFHGVAARSLRRPERYQGDGRPAWT